MTEDDSQAPAGPYDLATADHDFPAWEGPPRRTLLICTHPRSGSTLLGEALYFAGGLGCPLEYLHAGFRPTLEARWGTRSTLDYIRAVQRHRTDPGGTLSIKLFWRDVYELAEELAPGRFPELQQPPETVPPETYRALETLLAPIFPGPEFVHLFRRDRLRQAISGITATDTGQWRVIPHVTEPAPRGEPSFDYARIERLIGYSDFCHGHWRNLFASLGAMPHALSYEDLVADYRGTLRSLLAHLGSDAEPPPPRMRRQADERSEAFVLRYLREQAARGSGVSR